MSHFCALVILTPEYAEFNGLEESLAKYDESNEVDEYCVRKVNRKDKEQFMEFYTKKKHYTNKEFAELYAEKGADWNSNNWRPDGKGVWYYYSTYNPDSKWDWYSIGGRWSQSIKTKKGEYVDDCTLGEIDFEPYPEDCFEDSTDWKGEPYKKLKDDYRWHYADNDMPFAIIIDGVWYERGEMGWWAMVYNEKNKGDWNTEVKNLLANLPAESEVYNVDFHI